MKRIALTAVLCLLPAMNLVASDSDLARGDKTDIIAKEHLNQGDIHHYGRGIPQNFAKAVEQYRMGAKLGNAQAQMMLGFMYSKGKGVEKNLAEAYIWSNLAAASGHTGAINDRDIYADKLSLEELDKAQKQATKLFQEIQQRKARD